MSRDLHALIEAALEGNTTDVLLLKLDFPAGAHYSTTSDRAIVFGGNTYQPDGLLLSGRGPKERADGKTQQVEFTLAPFIISDLDDSYQFSTLDLYAAQLEPDRDVIDEPYLVGSFFMSHHNIRGGKGSLEVTLVCYSQSLPFRRRNGVISSGADQKARYAGDTGFDFAARAADREINWGGRRVRAGGGSQPPEFHDKVQIQDDPNDTL